MNNALAQVCLAALLAVLVCSPVRAQAEETSGEAIITKLDFKQSALSDAVRLLSELTGVNIVTSPEAGRQKINAYLRNVTALGAIDTICRANGLWYRQEDVSGTIRIMTAEEFQKDLVVSRDDLTEVFRLLNPNAVMIGATIRDVYGERVVLSQGLDSDDPLFEQDVTGANGNASTGAGLGFGEGGFGRQGRIEDGRTANRFGRSSSFTRSGARREPLIEQPLSPDQLAELTGEQAEGRTDELVRELSSRELPIYVSVVRQQNVIVLRTSDRKAVDDIRTLIDQLDRPTPQVLLEMRLLQVTLTDQFRSAFDIEILNGARQTGTGTSQPVNPLNTAADTVARSILGSGNFPLEASTLVYQYLSDELRLRLQLWEQQGNVRTISSPVLLASNNLSSRLFIGEERVMTVGVNTSVVTPGAGATTTAIEPVTEVRDIGNTLLIRPKINADDSVTLVINHDSSTLSPDSSSIPVSNGFGGVAEFLIDTVNAATLETTVVAKDGLTVAIGGLIRSQERESVRQVPWLGDIPYLGFFFRRTELEDVRTELVILITPHIIQVPSLAGARTLPVADRLSSSIPEHQLHPQERD